MASSNWGGIPCRKLTLAFPLRPLTLADCDLGMWAPAARDKGGVGQTSTTNADHRAECDKPASSSVRDFNQ